MWYDSGLTQWLEDNIDREKLDKLTERKIAETCKNLRKTVTEQLADEIFNKVMSDYKQDTYSTLLDIEIRLIEEVVNYMLDENYKPSSETNKSFVQYIQTTGFRAQKIRHQIYENNKDIINETITQDYIFEVLKYKFGSSHYWDNYVPKFNTTKYVQDMIVQGCIEYALGLPDVENFAEKIMTEKVVAARNELAEINDEIRRKRDLLNELR
jgi:hypothetical protein